MMKKILVLESQEDLQPRRQLFFKTLMENGYTIKVILWNRSGTNRERKEQEDGISFETINVRAKYEHAQSSFKIFHLYYSFFRKIISEQVDIIFCGHFFLLPLAVAVGKIKRSKIFYDAMEFYIHGFFGRVPNSLKRFDTVAYAIEDLLVKMCDGMTTIPSYQDCYLERYGKRNSNVEEIKNVPVLCNGNTNRPKYYEIQKATKDKKVIIYAGTISEQWGVLELLQSIVIVKEKYPDIKLLIIGKTRNNYEDVISHFVAVEAISSNVSFIGFIPYRDLSAYFQVAFAGIVPMQPAKKFRLLGNGTSRKVFEYMYAGLPVVASDFGELAQAVREENCGIVVDSTKPEQIADAIIFLLKNPEKARRMGERGRKAVEEKYNWQIESQKLLKVFDNL